MDDVNRSDLALLRDAAEEAGALAMRYFRRDPHAWHKHGGSPVTEADMAVDRFLQDALLAARPDYGWLSEETADNPDRLGRRRVWIVDPIDGTRSFIAKRPEFSISIGLAEDGAAVAGVVYNPARDELFYAAAGAGAHVELRGGVVEALRVSARTPTEQALLAATLIVVYGAGFLALVTRPERVVIAYKG